MEKPEGHFRPSVVCLVGRPNVGKSTLFNRVAGRSLSIVHAEPGSTRDRMYADVHFLGTDSIWIDTAGLDLKTNAEELQKGIEKQTEEALEEADVIVFVVDALSGLTSLDVEIANRLRRYPKRVVVLVNKAESDRGKQSLLEFYAMGFENVLSVSAAHGVGMDAFFECLLPLLPFRGHMLAKETTDAIAIAIVGRPNVGKSSLINKLLSEDRHLVSEVAGTTVDAVDSVIDYASKRFRLIDTAGIRRKRSIDKEIEKMAVSRALSAMDRASVVLLLLDAMQGLTEQDMKIASFAHDKGKGVVIVVNKWDVMKERKENGNAFIAKLREQMPFMSYAPVRLISARSGLRVFDVLDAAKEVQEETLKRVGTGEFNRLLERILLIHQPPVVSGRRVKIYYGSQVAVAPPTFLLVTNEPKGIHFSYQRFLINRLRDALKFKGAPIRLIFRGRERMH